MDPVVTETLAQMAGSSPVSSAMSSWAMVPTKASGNQLSAQVGERNSESPFAA